MGSILKGDTNFDFIGRSWLWALLAGGGVLASIVLVATVGLNFGVDFAGGYEIQVKFAQPIDDAKVKDLLGPLGLDDARVQRYGEPEANEFLIMVRSHGTVTSEVRDKLRADLEQLAGGADKVTDWSVAESGESMLVGFSTAVTSEQLGEVLAKHKLQVSEMTRGERADEPTYKVALVSLPQQVEKTLINGLGLTSESTPVKRVEFVGPQVGAQLRNQGILAVVWSLFFILLYIGFRFDFFFAPGAIIALLVDLAMTFGALSLLQLEFNLPAVAAILTIIGYSINDKIVVYDRVRENAVRLRGRELGALVNTSINQTLSRTLLTGGSVLGVLVILYVYGMGDIRAFAVALLVGVVIGTFSSMVVAAPVYVWLRERYGKRSPQADGGRSSAVTSAT